LRSVQLLDKDNTYSLRFNLFSNLCGFNLWVEEDGDGFIEFDSLINIRSWQGNPSRDVLNPDIRKAIKDIVSQHITE